MGGVLFYLEWYWKLYLIAVLAVLYVKWDVIGDLLTRDNVSWVLIAACLAFISGQGTFYHKFWSVSKERCLRYF